MSLRKEKRQLTRDRIMKALAEEVIEAGPHELSVQAVADRAGVSHRTVYRYYPSKDELFQGYGHWIDGRFGGREETDPESLENLGPRAAEVFRTFDEEPELMDAYTRIVASGVAVDVRRRRNRSFTEVVADATSGLSEDHQKAIAAMLRQVVNSQAWSSGRFDFGVEGEALADVAGWVVDLIANEIERGNLPNEWQTEEE